MEIQSVEQLDDLSDEELWEVAASRRNDPDIRHAALQRWLFPNLSEDELSEKRMEELKKRATKVGDELEEERFEYVESEAIYFDGEGDLIVDHDGVQYMIDSSVEPGSL